MKFKKSLAAAAAFLMTSNVNAQDINIFVNNAALSADQMPIVENSRVLVPFRAIFEALGADVEWDAETKTVTADSKLKLTIGDNTMYIQGSEPVELDVPAKIENSRTLVPIRAVSEGLGCRVDWDAETKTVNIFTSSQNETVKDEGNQGEITNKVYSGEVTIENEGEQELLAQYNIEYPSIGNPEEDSVLSKINDAVLSDIKSIESNITGGDLYSEMTAEYAELGLDYIYNDYTRQIEDMNKTDEFLSVLFYTNLSRTESESNIITSLNFSMETGDAVSAYEVLGITADEYKQRLEKAFKAEIDKENDDYLENAEDIVSENGIDFPFFITDKGVTVYAGEGVISENVTQVDIDADYEEEDDELQVEIVDIDETSGTSSSSTDDEDTSYEERVSDDEIIDLISNTIIPQFAQEVKGGSVTIGGYELAENTDCITVIAKKDETTVKFAVSYDLAQVYMYDDENNYYITLGY